MNRQKEEMVNAIVDTIIEIPPSSEDMGKIIDAVDDLACQANLLALSLAAKQVVQQKPLHDMR